MTTRKRTTTSRTTASRRTTSRRTTSRRTTSRRAGTRRRTTSTTYRTRRTPTVASSVGTAIGLLLVTTLLDASWPVRIGLALLGILLVGGYVALKARREAADEPPAPEPTPTPTETPKDPA